MRYRPGLRAPLLLGLALVLMVGMGPVGGRDVKGHDKGSGMNQASAHTAQAMKLPGDYYYSTSDTPFKELAKTLETALDPEADLTAGLSPVFALGLPRAVVPGRASALPAVAMQRYSGMRLWEVNFDQNLHVLVVDLRTGELRSVSPRMLDDREIKPSRSGATPSAGDRRASQHGFTRFNIPALFGDGWPSPGYAVTALYYDWMSNTAVVAGTGLPLPGTARSYAAWLDSNKGRPYPERVKVTLSAPVLRAANGDMLVAGTVQALSGAVMLTPQRHAMKAQLVFVTLDDTNLRTVDLNIRITSASDSVARGTFQVNLAERPDLARLAGEVQMYWVSGHIVKGPFTLNFSK